MANITSAASLKGKIRSVAQEHSLRVQEVLQMYLFEHLLMRLSKSNYAENFILKGGLLISSMIGIARRTTMDMDTTVSGISMEKDDIERALKSICAINVNDDMKYEFKYIEPIRDNDKYANWRAHLQVTYGRINAPIKVDITTGDAIVPGQISYLYPCMLDNTKIRICSYPLATILAEKFETLVRRGITNTRGRDFYDIYIFMKLYSNDLKHADFREAVNATSLKRGSQNLISSYVEILEDIRSSAEVEAVWKNFVKSSPYASGITFNEVLDACFTLGALL